MKEGAEGILITVEMLHVHTHQNAFRLSRLATKWGSLMQARPN